MTSEIPGSPPDNAELKPPLTKDDLMPPLSPAHKPDSTEKENRYKQQIKEILNTPLKLENLRKMKQQVYYSNLTSQVCFLVESQKFEPHEL